jgi:hypothetical protein
MESERNTHDLAEKKHVALSGYAARSRTTWFTEAVAVVTAAATYVAVAFASWECTSPWLSRWLASVKPRLGTEQGRRLVSHAAFRLAVLAPLVSITSSAVAGATYGLVLGSRTTPETERRTPRAFARRSIAVSSGALIALATIDPWRKALSEHAHCLPRILADIRRPVAVAAATSSGMLGGIGVSLVFTANVLLFHQTSTKCAGVRAALSMPSRKPSPPSAVASAAFPPESSVA